MAPKRAPGNPAAPPVPTKGINLDDQIRSFYKGYGGKPRLGTSRFNAQAKKARIVTAMSTSDFQALLVAHNIPFTSDMEKYKLNQLAIKNVSTGDMEDFAKSRNVDLRAAEKIQAKAGNRITKNLKKQRRAEEKGITKQHNLEKSDLEDKQSQEVKSLKADHEKERFNLSAKHGKEITDRVLAQRADTAALAKSQSEQLSKLETKHQQEMREVKKTNDQQKIENTENRQQDERESLAGISRRVEMNLRKSRMMILRA